MTDATQPEVTPEQAVMVCPQCDGEGGYPDGTDEAACHTDCTRCAGNGWIVDLSRLANQSAPTSVVREALGEIRDDCRTFSRVYGVMSNYERERFAKQANRIDALLATPPAALSPKGADDDI